MRLGPGGKVIAAGMIGNVLEWYDFSVYGYFAASIGFNFFPRQDRVAQLLAAFAVFALGYLVRPIGGALIGHVGDHYGRRAALTVSVTAMAVPTFLVGLLPGYATLGLLAPVLLVLLRMVQGLSVGGEYTSSMVFLVERAAAGRRGLAGAIAACGSGVGTLLGSGVGATIAGLMTTETLDAWGWRIPFLLGLVVGVIGFILRRQVTEFAPAKSGERSPIVETLRDHWRLVLRLAALSVFNGVSFYVMFLYVASWLQTADGISPAHALEINTISMVTLLPALLVSGVLSDRYGRKPVLMLSTAFAVVLAGVLAHVSPVPGADLGGTDRPRYHHRLLRRDAGDDHGRIRAAAHSLYRGRARLQHDTCRVRWALSAGGNVARRAYRRRARACLFDHGRRGGFVPCELAHQRDIPQAH